MNRNLAIASRVGHDLREGGFTCMLNLEPSGVATAHVQKLFGGLQAVGVPIRETDPVRPVVLASAVRQSQLWRDAQQATLVLCSDGKSRSALVIALYLMLDRGWDFAAAMWYIRQRRLGAWPRPQLMPGMSFDRLLADVQPSMR